MPTTGTGRRIIILVIYPIDRGASHSKVAYDILDFKNLSDISKIFAAIFKDLRRLFKMLQDFRRFKLFLRFSKNC